LAVEVMNFAKVTLLNFTRTAVSLRSIMPMVSEDHVLAVR